MRGSSLRIAVLGLLLLLAPAATARARLEVRADARPDAIVDLQTREGRGA